jgi:hypothetical protein
LHANRNIDVDRAVNQRVLARTVEERLDLFRPRFGSGFRVFLCDGKPVNTEQTAFNIENVKIQIVRVFQVFESVNNLVGDVAARRRLSFNGSNKMTVACGIAALARFENSFGAR